MSTNKTQNKQQGEIITVLEQPTGSMWWKAQREDNMGFKQTGLIPAGSVEPITDQVMLCTCASMFFIVRFVDTVIVTKKLPPNKAIQ